MEENELILTLESLYLLHDGVSQEEILLMGIPKHHIQLGQDLLFFYLECKSKIHNQQII